MRGWAQDMLRAWIAIWVRLIGGVLHLRQRRQIRLFGRTQRRLTQAYGLVPQTPIVHHGQALDAALKASAASKTRFAATSGSSGIPKQIPYTTARIRMVKRLYMDAFCRAFWAMGIKRTSLYVFSATRSDDSLTTLMMAERRTLPPYFSTLQAPYRVHTHPAMLELEDRYGTLAVRLWVLALSNPGALYATNPSTVALFLERVAADWAEATALVQDWVRDRRSFSAPVRRIARRLESRGSADRLERIANSPGPLPFTACVPAISFLCCWDGGYVRTYLDRIWAHLDPAKVQHVPMYSMSTETVETLPCFDGSAVSFLPIAPGVVSEFLPIGAPCEAEQLVPAESLQVGSEYSLVVSDAWGLTRYHTEDVFSVFARVHGLPDLRFERRLGLAFSFTGEKLTGDQARLAIDALTGVHSELSDAPWMVLVPAACPVPHYKLVIASDSPVTGLTQIAAEIDRALATVNSEYADKRSSARLGPPEAVVMPFDEALSRIGGQRPGRQWETQFKFLPMVARPYEQLLEGP
jgi:hypothetical protein